MRFSEIIKVAILASAHKRSQLCSTLAVLFTILFSLHTITNFLPGLIETFHLCLVAKDYSIAQITRMCNHSYWVVPLLFKKKKAKSQFIFLTISVGKSFTTNQWLSQFGFLCSDDSGQVFSLGIEDTWAMGWGVMAPRSWLSCG